MVHWLRDLIIRSLKVAIQMVAPHTCTGQIVQLNNTVTALNLSILAALAYLSTGLGLLIQLVKR